ncbi:hypothetical protein [Catenuloplanes japonicus]|uniref:hypothetical protein n=1 Tax=Catenuloplanes japonicus TaxID=33876 RepID=UPI000690BD5A|nr:hypothetical protein [Catenuloplanes japonicus]
MATPDSSADGAGSAREEAERLVAAVLARASEGASQAAWMAQGAKFAARASGHQTTSTGLGMLGDALRGVAKTASGFSEDLHRSAEGTRARPTSRSETDTAARPRSTAPAAGEAGPAGPPRGAAATAGEAPPAAAPRGATDAGSPDPGALIDDAPGPVKSGFEGERPHVVFANGSPECCVCPVCRAITMMRNPTPEFAEQLATSAGDLAAGVAGLLRAFSTAAADTSNRSADGFTQAPKAAEPAAGKPAAHTSHEDSGTGWPDADPWSAATRASASAQPAGDSWAAATRAGHAGHPADIDEPGTGDHEREFREAG